jgi:hypothetical protein
MWYEMFVSIIAVAISGYRSMDVLDDGSEPPTVEAT